MALMPPEEALRRVLTAESAVTDLVSARIYPGQAAYGATHPLITYQRDESEYCEVIDGLAGDSLARITVRLLIEGTGYASAKAVAIAVRDTLSAYRGTVEGGADALAVRRIRHMDEFDEFDPPSDGRTDGLHRVVQEYDIWFFNSAGD